MTSLGTRRLSSVLLLSAVAASTDPAALLATSQTSDAVYATRVWSAIFWTGVPESVSLLLFGTGLVMTAIFLRRRLTSGQTER